MISNPPKPRPAGARRVQRWLIWTLFVALLIPTGIRLGHQITDALALPPGTMSFTDFRLFLTTARDVRNGQPLYKTDQSAFFEPGSHVYKYPPPFAAVLLPIDTMRWKLVARRVYHANLGMLVLTLVLLLVSFGTSLPRTLGSILVFLAWQPFHESLGGLQLEPLMICLVALGFVLGRERAGPAVGFAVGVAAAFKVYPVLLGAFFLMRRDWRGIVGAGAGGLLLLGLSVIPLSLQESWIYFTEVLPGLGGTALKFDNVSLLANLGRAILRLVVDLDTFAVLTSFGDESKTLESSGIAWLSMVSKLLFLAISVVLISVTVRRLRRTVRSPETFRVGFLCSICLMTLLIPTSWLDYQTWLVLPAVYLTCRAQTRSVWVLLVISLAPVLTLSSGDPSYYDYHWLYSFLRSLTPIGLWAGLLGLVRSGRTRIDPPTSKESQRPGPEMCPSLSS